MGNTVSALPSWTRNKIVSSEMSIAGITYKTKTASEQELLSHLSECSKNFNQPLNNRVDLKSYSQKIAQKAITFEAWNGNKLVGLIAAYFNDSNNSFGYITNVSVLLEFTGKGIASELLLHCMNHAMKENYCEIQLQVNKYNIRAISLYKKHNFIQMDEMGENVIMQWKNNVRK